MPACCGYVFEIGRQTGTSCGFVHRPSQHACALAAIARSSRDDGSLLEDAKTLPSDSRTQLAGQAGSRSPFACAGHAAAVLNSGRRERGLGSSGSGDEWVRVQLRFPVTITARILLPSGTDVEVLSLTEVRDDLRTTAESIAATHVAKGPKVTQSGQLISTSVTIQVTSDYGAAVCLT
jgi:hypothetical protein